MFAKYEKLKNWDKKLLIIERQAQSLCTKSSQPFIKEKTKSLQDLQSHFERLSYKFERSLESLIKKKIPEDENPSLKKKAVLHWVKEWTLKVDLLYRSSINSLNLHMWIKSLQIKTKV